MYHKISEMCDKVNVIYTKSLELRHLKYSKSIKDDLKKAERDFQIDILIQDIQALCSEIANDKGKYIKKNY